MAELKVAERQIEEKFFIRVGDQVVNADNVVSFDIEGPNIIRIWHVGSPTPLQLKHPVPSETLIEVLQLSHWLH